MKLWSTICAATLLLASASAATLEAEDAAKAPRRDDVVVMNFDEDDYGDWTIEGEAFGAAPAKGTLPGQMSVSGFAGSGLANTFYQGDKTQGKATSPEFVIERPYVNFLIGGGGVPGLSFDLLIDGEVARTATGPNLNPGGSEALDWATWDVSELQGKKCVFRIVDEATGGWGHINVDQIAFSDKRRAGMQHEREMVVEKPYLLFPVKQDDTRSYWIKIEVDGVVVREFTTRLALATQPLSPADYNACVDMSPWLGKTCKFVVEKADEDIDFAPITFSDELYGGAASYDEKYRPQFHFSPRFGWTNDPNGLVYYNGEYHLFFQHNPFGVIWGNMTWGHATSPDLLHWTERGDAIYPDELGTIFSGSGAVDVNNTTGFQTDPNGPAPLVFMYTYNGPSMRYGNPASQALAYSLDSGKTLTKYEGNPTLPHIVGGNRDPKIFWYEPTQRWIVALYLDGEDYALFESKDLKSWTELCRIEKLGCSECPDIFELPVDGDDNNRLWVFWGGDGKYLLGKFDGKTFTRVTEPLNTKWGGNDYAAQSYSDTPGRRVQFSWMSGGEYPGMPFNQQFTVPRELSLATTPDGVRLRIYPVEEVATLRDEEVELERETQDGAAIYRATKGETNLDLLDAELEIGQGDLPKQFSISLRGKKIEFDVAAQTMTYDGIVAPCAFGNGLSLRLILDRTSIEIFANGGLSQISACFVPEDENAAPVLETRGLTELDAKVWTMKSVWNVKN